MEWGYVECGLTYFTAFTIRLACMRSLRLILVVLFTAFGIGSACTSPAALPASVSIAPTPNLSESPAAVDASAIYRANCSECHGAKGEGAKKGIPLTSGHGISHTDVEMAEQVINGQDPKMPAFKGKLSPPEIAAVVTYVSTVIQAGITTDQRLAERRRKR